MHKKTKLTARIRIAGAEMAVAIAASLLLSGCGDALSLMMGNAKESEQQVRKEQTIGENSKWINSSIPGAIDENTEVSLKDDYYTAVNKDKLLTIKLTSDYGTYYDRYYDLVLQRKIMIAEGRDDPEAKPVVDIGIDEESIKHDEELIRQFADKAGDWDNRNSLGSEPIFEYIKAIADIKDISGMNDFILNTNGNNFVQEPLVSFEIDQILADPKVHSVILGKKVNFSLATREQYISINQMGMQNDHSIANEVTDILVKLGYSEKDAQKVVKQCYEFEYKLADASLPSDIKGKVGSYMDADKYYSDEDVKKMQGNYPLYEMLDKYGYTVAGRYYIHDDYLIRKIGQIYCDDNLELIKSYYIVHTIQEAMPLLDKASYDIAKEYEERNREAEKISISISDSDGDDNRLTIDKEGNDLLDNYVEKYLQEPLEIVYISRYCSEEDKQFLSDITENLITYYKQMIREENWLSDAFKDFACEKLDFIKRHILYPDEFTDYSDLIFEEGDTLIDMVCKIKESDRLHDAYYAGKTVDPDDWNLRTLPTTTVNCYYLPGQNSINIFAGIMAGPEVYDPSQPYEYNMAKVGTMIGHEISHGFDSNGVMFDKYGNSSLNTDYAVDIVKLTDKTAKLKEFYDTLSPAPGLPPMSGSVVKNEVIADMGGVKSALAVGKLRDDFDIDLFFKSYADVWCEKMSYSTLALISGSEEHPCGMLRTNVTLSNMPEFIEYYDINPGDGMYVSPNNRISLW